MALFKKIFSSNFSIEAKIEQLPIAPPLPVPIEAAKMTDQEPRSLYTKISQIMQKILNKTASEIIARVDRAT